MKTTKSNYMIKNIINNQNLTLKDRLKNVLLYISRKRGAKKSWEQRHQKVFDLNDSYNKPCNTSVETEHQKIWSVFRRRVDMSTLRICKNISGKSDARIIPEDIFVSDIEPTLLADESVHFLSHKSFYNRWFPEGVFPTDILHCINGQYLDSNLEPITFKEFRTNAQDITFPVVMKPNKDSFGGKDVYFIKNFDTLIELCRQSKDFVVQERIIQNDFFNKFNPVGLNTIRVYVYKSVVDDSYHVLNMTLRMGKGGSLDNETSGGIHTMINEDGFLNNYAVEKYGQKYAKHPDSGYSFDSKIPAFDDLKDLSIKIAEQIFFSRIVGLDMCYDKNNKWRVIEVNTKGHTIRFSQYGGQPFFGEFTEEVIKYTTTNHWALK